MAFTQRPSPRSMEAVGPGRVDEVEWAALWGLQRTRVLEQQPLHLAPPGGRTFDGICRHISVNPGPDFWDNLSGESLDLVFTVVVGPVGEPIHADCLNNLDQLVNPLVRRAMERFG